MSHSHPSGPAPGCPPRVGSGGGARGALHASPKNQQANTGGRSAMKVALTGATGFIGSHVLTELQGHGHSVTAFARDAPQADTLAERGATPAVVDLYDRA